jgi:hypothetical protein
MCRSGALFSGPSSRSREGGKLVNNAAASIVAGVCLCSGMSLMRFDGYAHDAEVIHLPTGRSRKGIRGELVWIPAGARRDEMTSYVIKGVLGGPWTPRSTFSGL